MWLQNAFPFSSHENGDCEQSISDDVEFNDITYDCNSTLNLRTLYQHGKKAQLPVASQLKIFEECGQIRSADASELKFRQRNSLMSHEAWKPDDFVLKDEIERQEFQNREREFIHSHPRVASGSDEEAISDEENNVPSKISFISRATEFSTSHLSNFDSENQDRACTWSAVLKEAEELVVLDENAVSSSLREANPEAGKFRMGNRGKAKHKFSIRLQSNKEESSCPVMVYDENKKSSRVPQVFAGLEALEHRFIEHSMAELLEGLQEDKKRLSEVPEVPAELVSLEQRGTEHSMAELLEGLQEKNGLQKETSSMINKTKGRSIQPAGRRNISPLGNRTLDNEDPPEPMDSGTPSEDEGNDQIHLNTATPKIKRQSMADLFQEAISAAAVDDNGKIVPITKQTGTGYYARLQHVIQNEKDGHMEFLKQLQAGMSPQNESRCIDVEILSRYLDAKLTVCHCSVGENTKSSQCAKSSQMFMHGGGTRNKTIIFSSRVCGNVELEAGNLIRIHPPWKEVQVSENESIILCTFFSQILA